HITACRQILLGRVLDLVMADAVLARDKHHPRRRHARDIAGVVPRAADDVHALESQILGGGAYGRDATLRELHRGRVPDLLEIELEANLLAYLLRLGADGRIHLRQGLVTWMAEVDG